MTRWSKLSELPADLPAEAAVVGSMTIDSACISQIVEFIKKEDFIMPEACFLFEQIVALWRNQQPIDAVILRSGWLNLPEESRKRYYDYLYAAVNSVPTSANAVYYARLVYRKSVERKLIRLVEMAASQFEQVGTIEEKIELYAQITHSLPALDGQQKKTELAALIEAHLTCFDDEGGLPTSFTELDRMIGGFRKDNFILVAGRPSMGKSSILLDFYIHAARLGARPYLYSLEMTPDKIIERMMRNVARYRHSWYNKLSPEIIEAGEIAKKWPAWIEQVKDFKLEQICLNIYAQKQKNNIGICFIDYLQLIESNKKNIYEQITQISRELKKLALVTHIPIVALSQLNRACELRNNHRPIMSDLRDSGCQEQDADLILFLHREDYYRQKIDPKAELDGEAQCIVAKNREGVTGDVNLVWLPEYSSFGQLVGAI